ncbi:RsmB/NOP family class I SAM-dependent RNA methyltransferase [Desulfovibrio sp. OttesenSCG-928-C14]|nr:RsmB/NOP family class I SAM-dependent RNA methyltransferase [Desulfovibrio sp. OttesenSCG-928-C14]
MQKELRCFRLTAPAALRQPVLDLLAAQAFEFEPLPFYPDAFMLRAEPQPLGSSLAARFGLIYIQDPSSMLPALALLEAGRKAGLATAQPGGPAVLDMCSSPGGKSSLLARNLPGASAGFVLANEPGGKRLLTLRRNLEAMNMLRAASCEFSAEKLPLPSAGGAWKPASPWPGWDMILLDPPCSGWGTVEKNPQVLELWQGDKVKPLIGLQKMLLREAARLLKPGGVLVYSTCTVNVRENEEQISWALNELNDEFAAAGPGHGGPGSAGPDSARHIQASLELMPLEPFPGFGFDEPELGLSGVLRVSMGSPLGQGFFLAALRKNPGSPALPPAPAAPPDVRGGKKDKRGGKSEALLREPEPAPFSWLEALDSPEQCASYLAALSAGQKKFLRGSALDAEGGEGRKGREDLARIPASALEGPLLCPALLPPGRILARGGRVFFYPEAGLSLLPASFPWQGLPLGRSAPGSRPRPETSLRALMPAPEAATANGASVLNLEEVDPLQALLSGQSLRLESAGPEAGLYYKGLPLCRLKARGGRVFI